MDNEVIRLDHVTKEYRIYKNDKERFKAIFFRKGKYRKKIAVNNLNLSIKKGETVAIFGKNGAGKSTTLKMITGVVFPTKGTITVNGRVSALLELTAGFDGEFTGRENIYLRGQLLGLPKQEIEKILPEIIEFSELDEDIDQPVRTYSSGMKARLGFATNVSIQPEILIVDEALSVGDAEFRKKSSEKIKEIVTKDNVTFLFVTHSTEAAIQFCERGIVMNKGKMMFDGPVEEAAERYNNSSKRERRKYKHGG